jgi:hypothetical protein
MYRVSQMVKNTAGGNRAKRMPSKKKVRNVLPDEVELTRNRQDYAIGQVTQIYNSRHFNVITMDRSRVSVFCSTINSVPRVQNGSYVLMYTPNVEYHFKRIHAKSATPDEKYKSVIVALLTTDDINTLINRYGLAFLKEVDAQSDAAIVEFVDTDLAGTSDACDDVSIDDI